MIAMVWPNYFRESLLNYDGVVFFN